MGDVIQFTKATNIRGDQDWWINLDIIRCEDGNLVIIPIDGREQLAPKYAQLAALLEEAAQALKKDASERGDK